MSYEYDDNNFLYQYYDEYQEITTITETPEPANPMNHITNIQTAVLICNIIGGLANILLIFLTLTTKKCRTRTLLLHMCINDALLLLRIKLLLEYILHPFNTIKCLMEHLDGLLLTAYLLFLIAIQLNAIVHTNKLSTNWIVAIIYFIVCSVAFFKVTLCTLLNTEHKYPGLIVIIVMLSLAITTIVKDVTICCRRSSAIIKEEEIIRTNLARIVAYMILMTGVATGFAHFIFGEHHSKLVNKILHMLLGTRPVFVLLYLVLAQKELKMYFMNLFKRSENRYDWHASVRLPEGKNDDPAVTISISETEIAPPALINNINGNKITSPGIYNDEVISPIESTKINEDEITSTVTAKTNHDE